MFGGSRPRVRFGAGAGGKCIRRQTSVSTHAE